MHLAQKAEKKGDYAVKFACMTGPGAATHRFVAYLDDAAPQEAEIIVWSEHHIAEGDEVRST